MTQTSLECLVFEQKSFTCFEFCISVIVICLGFDICDLEIPDYTG